MLDNVMYGLKIAVWITAALSIRKLANGKSSGHLSFTLFGIALFMTGMEMITYSETPWQFLLSEANFSEWQKAVTGGFGMLMLPVIIYMLAGKDIQKLLDNTDSKS